MKSQRILIVSDSHGRTGILEAIADSVSFDTLIHCGDGVLDTEMLPAQRVLAVRGNTDRPDLWGDDELLCEIAGMRALITHGNGYQVKTDLSVLHRRAVTLDVGLVCFGHTHEQLIRREGDIILVNPGCAAEGFFVYAESTSGGLRFSARCIS